MARKKNPINTAYLSGVEDVEGFLLEQKEYGEDVMIAYNTEFPKGQSWKDQRRAALARKAGKGKKKNSSK